MMRPTYGRKCPVLSRSESLIQNNLSQSQATTNGRKQCPKYNTWGFSLVEVLIVVAIAIVVAAFASLQVTTLLKQAHGDNAIQLVQKELRSAHQQAMDDRTEYIVTFQAPGNIRTQIVQNGLLSNSESVDLPGDEQFLALPGLPTAPKSPDGFGNGKTAIDFDQGSGGGSNVLYFYPDGTVLDAAGNPNSGVVYIARPEDLYSSRALTIWGATGRVKAWTLRSNAGVPQWK